MYGSSRRLGRALTAVCLVSFSASAYAQTALKGWATIDVAQGFSPAGQTAAQAPKAEQKADTAALPSARTIIDRHIDAIGGRKAIAAHKSVRMQGSMDMPANGVSGKLELVTARPNKHVLRLTILGVGQVEEGFDGTRGWSVSPMTGPMLISGQELEERKFDADFDSDLRDDSRYEYIKTVEKTTFEGRPVYKIALKRKGGTTEDIEYYDVETGLKAGAEATRNTQMGSLAVVSIATDYKKFGDLMHPTTIKQKTMGIEQIMTVSSIEYDTVAAAAFEMPAAVKALVK